MPSDPSRLAASAAAYPICATDSGGRMPATDSAIGAMCGNSWRSAWAGATSVDRAGRGRAP